MQKDKRKRTLKLNRKVIGAPAPRPMTVRQRKVSDYPRMSRAHRDLAKELSSPLLIGPPICDELMAFVEHTFTEEEAGLARHLGGIKGKSAREVARLEHRPASEVLPILKRMAFEIYSIGADAGKGEKRRFRLIPVMPGIFEQVLMNKHPDTLSDWHVRFVELFEALYETGYIAGFGTRPLGVVRFLPLGEAVATHPAALPSDKLEVILDRYNSFAVGQCQCRTVMTTLGRGCGKPLTNCMAMGEVADGAVKIGLMQRITKRDALEIKQEAERHGLVSWIINSEGAKGQASCSCCGCCCHAMRSINEFNAPALSAPPHFLPRFDRSKCTYCGKCAKACPMGSLVVDVKAKRAWQLVERCVGCGLCTLACDKQQAITMEPVPDYRLPPSSELAMLVRSGGDLVRNVASAYLSRSPLSTWWNG